MKVVFCSFSASGNEDAVSYLRHNFRHFVRIVLSFHHVSDRSPSLLLRYKDGKKIEVTKLPAIKLRSKRLIFILMPFIYLVHLIDLISFSFIVRERYDVYIGQNYFCALGGVVLKYLGFVKKSVYWVGDYYPIPPKGIYHYLLPFFVFFDKYCLKYCDEVWFMTSRQLTVRKKEYGLTDKQKFKIIQAGINTKSLRYKELKDISSPILSSFGVLKDGQGIEIVIEALPEIIKKIPGLRFQIIGSGPLENELKSLVKRKKLDKVVTFCGYMQDENRARDLLSESTLAVALYRPDRYGLTQFADSGKVKVYLSCGLPVIVSDVPYIAEEVKKYHAGISIKCNKHDFVEAVTKLLTDRKLLETYKKNTIALCKNYSTDKIMTYALKDS